MVTLHDLEAHRFFTLDNFKIVLNKGGLVMVCGPNGSGKTAGILEAVRYGLYGTSFEYGARPGGQVWNRFSDEVGYVSIRLENSDGFYRIYRHGKHGGSTELDLFKEVDGKEVKISRGTNAETQKFITKNVLGMTEWLFCNSVMFSTDLMRFPNLSDTERKDLFDEILDTTKFTTGHEASKKALETAVRELEKIKFRCKVVRESIPEAVEITSEAQDVQETRDRIAKDLADCLARIKKAKARQGELEAELEYERRTLKSYEDNVNRLKVKQSGLNARIEVLSEQYVKTQQLIRAGKCSKCGQNTSELHAHEDPEVDKIKSKVRAIKDAMTAHSDIAAESRDIIEQYRTAIQKVRKKIEKLEDWKSELDRESRALASREMAVEMAKNAAEERQNMLGQLAELESKAAELQTTVDEEQILVELFGPRGARVNVINSVLPSLNQEAERIASIMHTAIQVKFAVRGVGETYAGTLSASVYNPFGAGQYRGNSAGERGRADIIILLSLLAASTARISGRFNHAFFDEAFEKLDTAGQRAILSVLREITKDRASVFIINHSAHELNSEVDQVWNMQKGVLTGALLSQ